MNEILEQVIKEIADLEERQLLLTANNNRTPLEEAELSLLPSKLAYRRLTRNTIVAALGNASAQTQGILLIA
jgi:hypothetical protein